MKNTIIGGSIITIIAAGIWFLFVKENPIIIEETQKDTSSPEELDRETLSINYTDIINKDVFIGDIEEPEDNSINERYKTLVKKYTTAFTEKDFETICTLTTQCNEKSNDAQKLTTKEKQYKTHSFEFWTSKKSENILCYKESIQLKNDSNTNPTIYIYSVFPQKKENGNGYEFKKPSCERVEKAPYGDITNNDPHNKRCGLNKKLCTQ